MHDCWQSPGIRLTDHDRLGRSNHKKKSDRSPDPKIATHCCRQLFWFAGWSRANSIHSPTSILCASSPVGVILIFSHFHFRTSHRCVTADFSIISCYQQAINLSIFVFAPQSDSCIVWMAYSQLFDPHLARVDQLECSFLCSSSIIVYCRYQ